MPANTTFVSGAILTAAQMNNLPFGVVSYTEAQTNTSLTTAEAVGITGASFTAISSRRYKLTYFEPEVQGGSSGYCINRIRLTNVTGALQNEAAMHLAASSISSTICMVVVTGLSGTVNFVGTLALQTGTGTAFGSGNVKRVLMVEDIGAV